MFTVVYALLGSHELRLWMITSAAVSLSGVVFAGRIAYKLTDAPPERRWAGWAAGIFAGLALLGIQDYFHYILSSQSDPMIVALCLAAIDLHLDGHTRLAFVAGALAGLGRPEVWPFLGLYLLGLGAPSRHPPGADRRGGGDGAALVRDSGAHLAHAVRGRRQRDGLRSPADLRPGRRHDHALPGAALLAARGRRPAGGGPRGVAAVLGRPRDAGARGRAWSAG